MSELARRLLEDALMLPDDERTQLALKLLVPVPGELSEAWRAEIQRRVVELEAGGATTYSWEEVRAEALKRMRK